MSWYYSICALSPVCRFHLRFSFSFLSLFFNIYTHDTLLPFTTVVYCLWFPFAEASHPAGTTWLADCLRRTRRRLQQRRGLRRRWSWRAARVLYGQHGPSGTVPVAAAAATDGSRRAGRESSGRAGGSGRRCQRGPWRRAGGRLPLGAACVRAVAAARRSDGRRGHDWRPAAAAASTAFIQHRGRGPRSLPLLLAAHSLSGLSNQHHTHSMYDKARVARGMSTTVQRTCTRTFYLMGIVFSSEYCTK